MSSDVDYTLRFKHISYNFGSRKFLFDGKDIYNQPYNDEIIRELKSIYRHIEKKLYAEKIEQNSVEKSDFDYLIPSKRRIDATITVDSLINRLSNANIPPFIILGERAIYESAKNTFQTDFFEKEITTLSIYQKNFAPEMMMELKKLNRFAEFVADNDHLKIIRVGKLRLEILNRKDDSMNTPLTVDDFVDYFRHSGVFFSSSDISEGERYTFINKSYHLIYRLILMLSRKTVLDKERKLLNIIVKEANEDEFIVNECISLVKKINADEIISKALDVIHTENSLQLKNKLFPNNR